MSDDPLTLRYDPTPEPPPPPAGVTRGWVVIHRGQPQPGDEVMVADAAILRGEDGETAFHFGDEWRTARVVDDQEDRP